MLESLSSRLRLGIGAILLAFSLSGAVSVIGVISSTGNVSKIIDASEPTIVALDRMETSILRQHLLSIAYGSSGGTSTISAILAERRGFDAAKAELAKLWKGRATVDAKFYDKYANFVALQDEYIDATNDIERLKSTVGRADRIVAESARAAALQQGLAAAQDSLLDGFDRQVRKPLQDALGNARTSASSAAWRSLVAFGVLTLIAAAISLLVGNRLMRGIRAPLGGLVEAMERIASGDRAARLEDTGIAEFAPLESSFNDMAERLDEAEQGLKRSYDGQRKILDEIPVGFLTMGPNYLIEPEYSTATECIFGRVAIAALPFPALLFPEGPEAKVEELKRYLKQLFENTTADKEFLDEINPVRELVLPAPQGERIIGVGFDRLYENDKVSDVLATIEDRTDVIMAERSLAEERRSHKRDADSIQAILSIGPGPLKDFFTETREMITRIRESLGDLGEAATLNSCFRFLHSIKGAAGSFGIEAIAMTAHEAEDIFAGLRESGLQPSTQELVRINVLLGMLGEELDSFEDLVARLKSTLLRLEESDAKGEERNELEEFLQSLSAMMTQLEKSLSKPMGLVTDVKVSELPHLREMRTVIIHLIRNAADHGLEDEYERLFQGKAKDGRIWLRIRSKDEKRSAYLIEVEDDGQGINFDRIAEKALEKGLLTKGEPATDKSRLLSMLFRPGFSTKEKADEISGRGVGLDLVRDIVKSLGGSISVSSSRGRGTKFTVTVPY
jgi:signal transduction histidine kinase/HAMP domain-containing protein